MNPVFWARQPVKGATAPKFWSYSSLALWKHCPLQWFLSRAEYEGIGGHGYPARVTAPSLQGRAVHAALQEFAGYAKRSGSFAGTDAEPPIDFPIRATIRRQLDSALSKVQQENPRADVQNIKAHVNLDESVNLFKRLVARLPRRPRAPGHGGSMPAAAVWAGTEVWVEVDNPRICGRLDIVTSDAIIDFKTGEPSPQHADQLAFYAVLWWLRNGDPPGSLEVVYARPPRTEVIPVPTLSELKNVADSLRVEIEEAHLMLSQGTPPPRPDATVCATCSVRQLCDVYWTSHATAPLRAVGLRTASDEDLGQRWWRDVYVDRLPQEWLPGFPCVGVGHTPDLGDVILRLDRSKCPDAGDQTPRAARLIGAAVTRVVNGWEVGGSKLDFGRLVDRTKVAG